MWYQDDEEFKGTNGYEVNGSWYPRVTRILEVKAKPALDSFFKEMERYSAAEKVKEQSAKEGSLVHATVEKLIVGEKIDIPDAIKPGVEAFQEFNEGGKITFFPEYVERTIWSGRHRYAGTVDALASVDGKFGVLDIKTSTGFYPEYNLQTAAYASALQEFEVRRMLGIRQDVVTRWILRIDQHKTCGVCKAQLREKGGRKKIRPAGRKNSASHHATHDGDGSAPTLCGENEHEWSDTEGNVELREFPYLYKDIRAFVAAKILWEWDNDYWLRKIGYLK